MDYKYCVQCGAKLNADAKFCDHCGAKQPNLAPKRSEVQHQATPTERPTREELHRQQVSQATAAQPTVTVKQPTSQPTAQRSNVNNNYTNYQQPTEAWPNQQQYASSNAYNESGRPGLLNSFDVWVKNALHPSVCMGRADYWWGYLGMYIIEAIMTIAFIAAYYIDQYIVSFLFMFLIFIFLAVLSVWSILATIERIHDTGKSGWNFCWGFIPFVGGIIVLVFLCQPTNRRVTKWPRP